MVEMLVAVHRIRPRHLECVHQMSNRLLLAYSMRSLSSLYRPGHHCCYRGVND